MTNHNKVTGVLSDANLQKILNSLDSITGLLPFLMNLSVADRKKLRRMGDKSIEYVNLCKQGAQTFPQTLKANFDVTEFQSDVNLINSLKPIMIKMQALLEGINDTLTAAGSDAMMASDEVYAELKSSSKKDANVKTLVDQIGQRYSAQSKPRKKIITKA